MFAITWKSCKCIVEDEFSALSVYIALEKQDESPMVYNVPTGARVDPHKGMSLYAGQGYHAGRFINGGWQKLAELERETVK